MMSVCISAKWTNTQSKLVVTNMKNTTKYTKQQWDCP